MIQWNNHWQQIVQSNHSRINTSSSNRHRSIKFLEQAIVVHHLLVQMHLAMK